MLNGVCAHFLARSLSFKAEIATGWGRFKTRAGAQLRGNFSAL